MKALLALALLATQAHAEIVMPAWVDPPPERPPVHYDNPAPRYAPSYPSYPSYPTGAAAAILNEPSYSTRTPPPVMVITPRPGLHVYGDTIIQSPGYGTPGFYCLGSAGVCF